MELKSKKERRNEKKSKLENNLHRYNLPDSNRDCRLSERCEWNYFEYSNWAYWLEYGIDIAESIKEINDDKNKIQLLDRLRENN